MKKIINIGDQTSALKTITEIKDNDYVPFDIEIKNSHILVLNKIIGLKIFRNNKLFISSKTLHEIMGPIGGRGKHHFHGLTPNEILNTLKQIRFSKEINVSYDGRYVIITLATNSENIPLAVIVEPNGSIHNNRKIAVTRIVTIYPQKKK